MGTLSLARLSWPAPAKINLFLHVLGQREDGYHLLQTAFQFLDIADELSFNLRDDDKIIRHANYDNVPEQSDIVVRATTILREHSNTSFGVDIHINKRLPMGGGLGGGSSDAATTLVALNSLVGLNLSLDKLAALGLKLGADVPVFVHRHAAWAEGVGEKLTKITPPEDWFLVVIPDCEVATADIFNSADLTRNTPAITIRDFLAGAGHNDCEKVVCERYPEIADKLDWLGQRYETRMTGTGACLFARFANEGLARQASFDLPTTWQRFVAKGLNESPLSGRLAREKSR
ncbi:MAG: 4-diphosphocytidyl-2-C-methyl-D-erythritol kinase [Gammaproteobacteria bacterium]